METINSLWLTVELLLYAEKQRSVYKTRH